MSKVILEYPRQEKIVYVDEVGRGCLFGPVVAAGVIMPTSYDENDKLVTQINDSKKVSAKKRLLLSDYIKDKAIAYGIGIATVEEIDKYNILQATYIAMHRALDNVYTQTPFRKIEVDGNKFKPYMPPYKDGEWIDHECYEGGDSLKMGIAAASILAKVHRDTLMESLCEVNNKYNDYYDIGNNKGYGTPKHMNGLKKYGACSLHRRSFAPVAKAISNGLQVDIIDFKVQ